MGMWSLILIWDHEPIFIIEVVEAKMYVYVRHAVHEHHDHETVKSFMCLPCFQAFLLSSHFSLCHSIMTVFLFCLPMQRLEEGEDILAWEQAKLKAI